VKLGNLAARIATAVVLVPPLVLAIKWDEPYAVWGIVFAATLLSLHEYFSMALPDDEVDRWAGIVFGGGFAALLYWYKPGIAIALPAAVLVPGLWFLFRHGDLTTVTSRLGKTAFGVVYAGLCLTYIAFLKRDLPWGGDWVLIVLMTAFFGDTGAYAAGRLFGRTKLYPAISPGKTRAGAVGGLAGSFLAAVLGNLWFFPELGWGHGAAITLVGGALGQCGDLVESMLKRSCGVKDSGKLLPGHGGMLDRIDAVLFIAPWVYLYAVLVWLPHR
jgi:phosphatidate cytidylyltransferase